MDLSLNDVKWKTFYLKELFSVKKGTRLTVINREDGNIPFVTAGHENQGISSYIGNKDLEIFKNAITIDMFGEAFYRDYAFCCDDNIHVLLTEKNLSKLASLFICNIINSNSENYGYGNQFRVKSFNKQKIKLPITDSNKPNYEFMEKYMEYTYFNLLNKYKEHIENKLGKLHYKQIKELDEVEWDTFILSNLGEIKSGKDISKTERIDGNIPYISATSQNNGITDYVNNENNTLERNCISINRTGSVGYSFYHPYQALFSNNCRKLILKNKNKYISLFIVNQIKHQKEKYSYGYIMGTNRLKEQKITLPVTNKGEIDYEYMEQYMINLEINLLNNLNSLEINL